jgi:Fe2+ transport system protein FeoA
MQLTVNRETVRAKRSGRPEASTLVELAEGEQAVIEKLELPDEFARRLMELGFLPGHVVTAARGAPGGDPRVFRVDGSEVALRRETAARLLVRSGGSHSPTE